VYLESEVACEQGVAVRHHRELIQQIDFVALQDLDLVEIPLKESLDFPE
jgi:hypothetical protein